MGSPFITVANFWSDYFTGRWTSTIFRRGLWVKGAKYAKGIDFPHIQNYISITCHERDTAWPIGMGLGGMSCGKNKVLNTTWRGFVYGNFFSSPLEFIHWPVQIHFLNFPILLVFFFVRWRNTVRDSVRWCSIRVKKYVFDQIGNCFFSASSLKALPLFYLD